VAHPRRTRPRRQRLCFRSALSAHIGNTAAPDYLTRGPPATAPPDAAALLRARAAVLGPRPAALVVEDPCQEVENTRNDAVLHEKFRGTFNGNQKYF
jgi:hypothetical protein